MSLELKHIDTCVRMPEEQLSKAWDPLEGCSKAEICADDQLFAAHLMNHKPGVHHILSRFICEPHDQDDVVAETMIRALTRGDRSVIVQYPVSWMVAVARRIAIDNNRKREARPPEELLDTEDVRIQLQGPPVDVEFRVLANLGIAHVLKLLSDYDAARCSKPLDLAELYRKIFFEGMTYSEYAREKGIPTGTVKSRIAYARRNILANAIRPYDHN